MKINEHKAEMERVQVKQL